MCISICKLHKKRYDRIVDNIFDMNAISRMFLSFMIPKFYQCMHGLMTSYLVLSLTSLYVNPTKTCNSYLFT
jgi:hypothetical protein